MDVVLQDEISDCGLCCLSMIMSHYKKDSDLSHFTGFKEYCAQGASLAELKRLGEQIGFDVKGYKTEKPGILWGHSS